MSRPVCVEQNIYRVVGKHGNFIGYTVKMKFCNESKDRSASHIQTLAEAQRIKREWLSERNAAKCQRPVNSEVARGWGYA